MIKKILFDLTIENEDTDNPVYLINSYQEGKERNVKVVLESTSLLEANTALVNLRAKEEKRRKRAWKGRASRVAYSEAMKAVGLRHVKGNLGGSYWE